MTSEGSTKDMQVQREEILQRMQQYTPNYRHKAKFIKFCHEKVLFTGSSDDIVLRRDLNDSFKKHAGMDVKKTIVGMGQHLLYSGVRMNRKTRLHYREYCYVGIRLADGPGRRHVAFISGKEGKPASKTDPAAISKNARKTRPCPDRSLPRTSTATAKNSKIAMAKKDTQSSAMVQALLRFKPRYKGKGDFIKFCLAHVAFTGKDSDFVNQNELNKQFILHSGVKVVSPKNMSAHLLSAGVKWTNGDEEGGQCDYRGILLTNKGTKHCMDGNRRDTLNNKNANATKVTKSSGAIPQNSPTVQSHTGLSASPLDLRFKDSVVGEDHDLNTSAQPNNALSFQPLTQCIIPTLSVAHFPSQSLLYTNNSFPTPPPAHVNTQATPASHRTAPPIDLSCHPLAVTKEHHSSFGALRRLLSSPSRAQLLCELDLLDKYITQIGDIVP